MQELWRKCFFILKYRNLWQNFRITFQRRLSCNLYTTWTLQCPTHIFNLTQLFMIHRNCTSNHKWLKLDPQTFCIITYSIKTFTYKFLHFNTLYHLNHFFLMYQYQNKQYKPLPFDAWKTNKCSEHLRTWPKATKQAWVMMVFLIINLN